MWFEERRQRIRTLLATFGRVTVDRITSEMNVSRETARRDLMEMEAEGELRRVRGGAVALDDNQEEPPFLVRASVRVKEKRMIAKAAAQLISSGQILFLDAGSTTAILAEELSSLSGLTVITNSVEVAQKISERSSVQERGNRALLVGGEMSEDPPATFGEVTVNDLHRYQVDIALLSPFGLDVRKGATSFNPHEAEVARAMIQNSGKLILLADHSKIGTISRIAYCTCDQIDHLVVDARAANAKEWASLASSVKAITLASRI